MSYNDRDEFYQKFNVTYADDGRQAEYPWFVLRYARDPHAQKALAAYADSCENEMPGLAADLRAELERVKAQQELF